MPNTTNHNVPLPTVGASADTWGGENNDAHQSWDTLTSGAQNTILGRVAVGSGPMTQLTGAQVATAIPAAALATRGVVKASNASTDTNRPLTGDGNFKKGIGRFAGAQCVRSGNQVLGGFNIASAVWNGAQRIDVTFTTAAANVNYQVHAFPMSNDPAPVSVADNLIVRNDSKTVNGFALDGNVAHTAMSISVFEG